jgi:AcrR family transcriptional regulator
VSVDESAIKQPAGRRSRKVQRTRSALTRSALDLFAERGFDKVTVTDTANRADVDPSTFFRHFRSKESVLFTDMDMYVARIRGLVHQRPSDEPILDTLHAVSLGSSPRIGSTVDFAALRPFPLLASFSGRDC